MEEAKTYLLERFTQNGNFAFLPEGVLDGMLETVLRLDANFMKTSGVDNGGAYDDEAACDFLFDGMARAYPEFKMYMLRFTEDYLDYNEDYLISIDAIEWE